MTEETFVRTCERCDAESAHLVKFTNPDNTEEYICWSCLQREEKRHNLKSTWHRGRRDSAPRAK
ncbi:MAG: hypothetical protein AUG51_24585 [Acidobacteria bacterium 13_1_20CM_3_53_8]|nr:MAG: hypothetical protein AUG51_24585 [Acidobacteria bacterium 13_1_20CM_3_53_8]